MPPTGLTWAHGRLYAMLRNRIEELRAGHFSRVAALNDLLPKGLAFPSLTGAGLATMRNGDVLAAINSRLIRIGSGTPHYVGKQSHHYTLAGQSLTSSATNDVMIDALAQTRGQHPIVQAYGLPARR